jgi:hypothetical protein
MKPRTVILIGALGLTAGWLGGATTSSNQQNATGSVNRGPRPLGMESAPAAPLTRELRERLDAQPTPPPSRGRNPFTFGARGARRSTEPVARRPELSFEPPAAPVTVEPPPLRFRLSGIASSVKDGVSVLTAIVNDNGAMAFVKTGDRLSNGFTVVRVDETSVVIADATGVTQTLRLP